MKKFRSIFIIILLTIILGNLYSAELIDGKYILGEQLTLKSEILGQIRKLLVYVPTGYDDTTVEYPVLYLLDGGFHFHHVTGIVQFLTGQGMMSPTIVVAIQNIDRNKDFLPTKNDIAPTSGGGSDFLNFISEELIPFIDEAYRTAPYRLLVGHSFGGTFTAYTFLERPELFNAYIAISPYLHWDDEMLIKKAENSLLDTYSHNTFFYLTLGDEPPYYAAVGKFNTLIDTLAPENLDYHYVHMPAENHGSIPHKTIYDGLEKIFAGWGLQRETFEQGLAAMDEHYRALSERFGYPIRTPEMTINQLGYNYLMNKEISRAIAVFQENVKRYPGSANVYDSLGEAYENNEEFELAKENYAKAVDLADKEHPNLEIFQQNLVRMLERLEKK